jgi:hypothetical protein
MHFNMTFEQFYNFSALVCPYLICFLTNFRTGLLGASFIFLLTAPILTVIVIIEKL